MGIKIISAGAGSGKTHRLTQEMVNLLRGGTRASGIIATTFTAKAAAELQDRVRTKLLEEGLTEQANDLSNALIGTVHGLGVKLLKRFAFEAGVSPQVDIIADEDVQIFFNQSLAQILTYERVERMNELCDKLGMTKKSGSYDWRRDVRTLVDVARANAFSNEMLEFSKKQSFESFKSFFETDSAATTPENYNAQLLSILSQTITTLETQGDDTKTTADGIADLKMLRGELERRGFLHWFQWVKLMKTKVGAKSRDFLEELVIFVKTHTQFPDFQSDIQRFINELFDIAQGAISEYDRFKKQRGLIDYTDMEVLVRDLLDYPSVRAVLEDELDLLMVDEFQDTSPIQLDIFLKLSKIAKHSIWVGDPKQSIYGFRGAEPRLMQAIIAHVGIRDEDILKDSWRSRPDVVFTTNALFCRAFNDLPTEQVALNPKRKDINLQTEALIHWHFQLDNGGDKRNKPNADWFENCVAEGVKKYLEKGLTIEAKGEKTPRTARAGDFAILCRTNDQCKNVAEKLHRVGLKAAIARTGLLETAEAKLVLAVLRYILNKHDSLAVAEALLLAEHQPLANIIEHRLGFLDGLGADNYDWRWAHENDFIRRVNELRRETAELSANEILNLVLDELDLRRIIATWGNASQRLENVDVLRKYALQYESACNRLHTAASLGGFLLWLAEKAEREEDTQSSGESPDAVNVLTYHKSKGLEYPVVVMGSLDQSLRDPVFGVAIENTSDTEGVDLDNILGGRWLRYWVNPYADQFRGTPLEEKINNSVAKANATRAALSEEARLLYVGVTRARDYLVFPTYQGGVTKWLNRAWHHGNEDFPTLDTGFDTVFEWNGVYVTKEFDEMWFDKSFAYAELSESSPSFIEPRLGKKAFLPYKIDPFKENFGGEKPPQFDWIPYAGSLKMKEDAQPFLVAKAFNALLTAATHLTSDDAVLQTAKGIVTRYDVAEMLDFQNFVNQQRAFAHFLQQRLAPQYLATRYPIRGHFKDRLFELNADLWVECADGSVAFFINSDYSGDVKKLKSELAKFQTTLYLARETVRQLRPSAPVAGFVHFFMHGQVAEAHFTSL